MPRRITTPPTDKTDNGQIDPVDSSAGLDFDPAQLDAETPRPADQPAGPDPFDPAALRISGDFNASVGVHKALLSVPVRKPDKSWFVRAHPDPNYHLTTWVIEMKED